MMKGVRTKIQLLFLCFLLLTPGGNPEVAAQPLGFDGIVRYQQQGGDLADRSATEQTYRLSLLKDLSASSLFSGEVRYNDIDQTGGNDSTLIAPTASVDLRNDLFVFNLNGGLTRIENESTADLESRSWNANWFTTLPRWPLLRLTYGQTKTRQEDGTANFDTDTTTFGANLIYDVRLFHFLYDYKRDEVEEEARQTKSEAERHLAQISYNQSLFGSRLILNASEQVSYTRFEDRFSTVAGEARFRPVIPIQGLAAADDTPAFGSLDPANALIDGNLAVGVIEILQPTVPSNLGLALGLEMVEQIRLIFDRRIDAPVRGQLFWQVYTSGDNLNWAPIGPVVVEYEEEVILGALVTMVEITLPSPSSEEFIKVVVENPGAPLTTESAFVTEIVAGTLVEGTGGEGKDAADILDLKTVFGVTYRVTPKWNIGYRFDHLWREDENDAENWSMTNSLSSNYFLNRSLSVSAGVTENRDNRENRAERISRTYSGAVNSKPLHTLDLSLGYTHLDFYEGGDIDQKADTVYGNLIALLYPDLSSALTGTWSNSENVNAGTETTNYVVTLDITARMSPRLNVHFDADYGETEVVSADRSTRTDGLRYGTRLSYRPSDLLLIQGDLERYESEDSTRFFASLFWRMTPKIQNNATVILHFDDSDRQSYQYRLSWTLSPHLFFDAHLAYHRLEAVDTWEIFSSLNVSL